jgi:phospholipase/lecithinase/hemolysin
MAIGEGRHGTRGRGWAGRGALAALSLAATCALGVLSACGGGTTAQTAFTPDRVIAFGDETSLLRGDGRKFAVNALNADDTIDCVTNPIWVQAVATSYSYVFAECNPSASAEVKAFMRAGAGAKADDVKVQIDAQIALAGAGGGVKAGDLITVLAGANDVLEQYALYPGKTEADMTTELRARGERLAQQVNRLVNLGARVIVATAPDVGVTPFAVAEKAAKTDTDRAALLTRLTAAFNGRVRVTIVNDGRFIGLVLTDEMVQAMVLSPASFALVNSVDGACTAALPDCTSKTLKEGAAAGTYLWADATRMAHGGHVRLGLLGVQRALNNPF